MNLKIANIEIGFSDLNGVNKNADSYRNFANVSESLDEIGSGLTGGHHGTDHAYTDYRVNENYIIRQVHPGTITGGYLELIVFPLAEEEAQKANATAQIEYENQMNAEYEEKLRSEC